MGKQGAELRWWDQSSSSTVLLDPAALVESCKQQIQGKDGIPAEHQRLIFACRVANQEVLSYTCKRSSTCPGAEDNAVFLEELGGWEAILKDDNHNIAKLLHPLVRAEEQVAAEDERKASQLSCQTARELRSMGIPCNVYYLFFDKWIPASLKTGKCCKQTSNVEIQIDKDFLAKSFQILLFGRLSGSNLPLPFVYRMNGGEVAAQLSMLEQVVYFDWDILRCFKAQLVVFFTWPQYTVVDFSSGLELGVLGLRPIVLCTGMHFHSASVNGGIGQAQYRQGQKTRHRLGLSTQSVGKGVEGRDVHTVVNKDGPSNGCDKSEHVDDYYCPCGKGLDFTVTISKDHKLKCFVLKVIQVPARKPEQLASHVPVRCERGNSDAQHDSNKYCVSSSGATSLKCESTVLKNKVAFAESLSTKGCQFAKQSLQPWKGGEPSGSCPLEVPGPRESPQLSTSDSGASPQNVSISSTDNGPEGLPIFEEPLGKLSKKKKKKRKGKRNGKGATDTCSSTISERLDSAPAVSTNDGYLDSCTQPAMDESCCRCFETTCCSGSIDDGTDARNHESPLVEDIVRELSTCGEKAKGGLVNIFRREVQCVETSMENCVGSMVRAEEMKIGQGYLTAEQIIAEIVSDQKAIALSKESSKDRFGTGPRHADDFLPAGRDIPCSSRLGTESCEVSTEFRDPHALSANVDHAYMCTSTCLSNNLGVSQPFVGPIMVEMGLQKSSPPARSSGDSMGSHYPSRELVGNLERVIDAKDDVDFSAGHFSARGGYNGSGTGSRNARGGSDGSGNRSHGRGSEDRKGTSGYHGGGQGSSGGSHGGGPGGSSTSGSSGGSGGGNGNRGGGRGSSGGSWDGRRSDDDGANGSKEGDNDERYRDSFQAGSNGEVAADSMARKKGISSLDNRGNHGRKGVSGAGDQLMNGTTSSHGCLAASSSGGKENINSWQKVQKSLADDSDELTEDSVPPSQSATGSEEGTPRTRVDQKSDPPSAYMNGFLQHELPPTKESHEDYKDIRNSGAVPGQDSLKGAWQRRISWDDQGQPSYNKYVPEGSSHVGPSKGKLSVKPTRNGMRVLSPDSDVASYTKSLSAPATPNGSQDDFADSREFNKNYSMKSTDGHIYQSAAQTVAREPVVQARIQVVNTAAVRQSGEARSAPEEAFQRSTTSKSRKPSGDQERPQGRDKIVGDRERTPHWAQKWVPVEHKTGGSVKGSGTQFNSTGNVRSGVPTDCNVSESNASQQDYVNSTEIDSSEEVSRKDGGPSSSLPENPPSASSSRSLRRLQTFPFGTVNTMLRVSSSETDAEEPRESLATVTSERPSGHPEHANLRGLLPRERILDNPSTQVATRSTAGGYSTSVQSPIAGEQKNKLRLDDRSSKGGAVMVKPVLSPAEEETRRVARAILDAVHSSCRDRSVAEVIVREVGCPMAEFEKVLSAVAPSFSHLSQTYEEDEFSICRCRVSHIPLNSIWQWYEEPSYCGVEVRAVDSPKVQKNGEEEPFLAYFVPYLSGLQIFGYSSDGDVRSLGDLVTTKGNMDSPLSSQRSDMLATLFPTPGKSDESSSHVRPTCTMCGQKKSSSRDEDSRGIHLLYEFYDADPPQVRPPMFLKVNELVEGVSSFNSYSRGDPAVLDRLYLGDVHPASWFAVAWYPIYRISEGPLRAVFLTYHSFNHFAPQRSLSCLMGRATDVDDSVSMPVVGLECYNLQGEPWLSMGVRFSKEATKVSERVSVNSSQCLENRISSLQEVAAGMAKGIPDDKAAGLADGSSSNKFRHSDYEFFVKRRR